MSRVTYQGFLQPVPVSEKLSAWVGCVYTEGRMAFTHGNHDPWCPDEVKTVLSEVWSLYVGQSRLTALSSSQTIQEYGVNYLQISKVKSVRYLKEASSRKILLQDLLPHEVFDIFSVSSGQPVSPCWWLTGNRLPGCRGRCEEAGWYTVEACVISDGARVHAIIFYGRYRIWFNQGIGALITLNPTYKDKIY